jgi:hypothetical protein
LKLNLLRLNTITIKKSVSLIHTRNFKQVDDVNSLFTWQEMIGSGSHGSVFRATQKKWNIVVAVKIVNKERLMGQNVLMHLMRQELHVCE